MAYGVKHRIEFDTFVYNQAYRIDILELLYTGAINTALASSSPARLRQDNGEYVRGTSLEISLISETNLQYIEFFTSDYKKYKVELYKANTLIWSGFLSTDFYSEPYIAPPYAVNFTAIDNIGQLKNIKFSKLGLSGRVSQLNIINYILLSISDIQYLATDIELHSDIMNPAQTALDAAFVKTEFFRDNDYTCYDFLEDVLKQYNSFITQNNGIWVIQRKSIQSETKQRYLYLLSATGATPENNNTLVNWAQWDTLETNKNIPLNLNLEIKPASLATNISIDLKANNLLPGSDFTDVANNFETTNQIDYTPKYWTDPNGLLINSSLFRDFNNWYLIFDYLQPTHYIQSQKSKLITPTADQYFEFTISCSDNRVQGLNSTLNIYLMFISDVGVTYYLKNDNTWTNTATYYTITLEKIGAEFKDYKVIFELTGTGTEPGQLQTKIFGLNNLVLTVKKCGIEFQNLPSKISSEVTINSSAINNLNDISIIATDLKINSFTNNNIAAAFANNLLDTAGNDLKDWDGNGAGLLEVLANEIIAYNNASKHKLSGEVLSENPDTELIVDTNTSKKYEVLNRISDLVNDKINITLLEIL